MLLKPFGGGIDRRQVRLHRGGAIALDAPVLGVNHFEAGGPVAHLAEAAKAHPAGQRLALGGGEIEKTQHDAAAAVSQMDQQRAAATETDLRVVDEALDDDPVARPCRGDRRDPGTVLVAQRQMEQQILHRIYAYPRETLRRARTHASQRTDREVVE